MLTPYMEHQHPSHNCICCRKYGSSKGGWQGESEVVETAANFDSKRGLIESVTGCGFSDRGTVQVVLLHDDKLWKDCLGTDEGWLNGCQGRVVEWTHKLFSGRLIIFKSSLAQHRTCCFKSLETSFP